MSSEQGLTKTYSRIIKGTALLSLSSLLAKILSAVYRIPFQNLVGNVGFYTYQQIYPLYGIAVTISLTGIPVFISQSVAAYDDLKSQRAIAKRLMMLLWLAGSATAAVLYAFAPLIGQAMGDRPLGQVIRGVAPIFIFAPLVAAARGFRQGRLELAPTAVSQIGEQTVRVVLIILVAFLAAKNSWNVYFMGQMAMLASVAGSLTAIIILIPTFKQLLGPAKRLTIPISKTWHLLWTSGGILCLLGALMVLLQLVDAFTVKRALVSSGLSQHDARFFKGVFDRAQPLAQLGLVIANSFVALLMPGLSKMRHEGKIKEYWHLYSVMIHYCLAISTFAAGGLIVLMPQINQLLFKSRLGSFAIAVEMISVVLVSLINCFASVLQTSHRRQSLAKAILFGLIIKVVVNYWLVYYLQIVGAALGTILALVAMTMWCYHAIPKPGRENTHLVFAAKVMLVTLIMMMVAKMSANLMEFFIGQTRFSEIFVVFVAVILGAITAISLTLVFHLFTDDELRLMPAGSLFTHRRRE